MAFRRKLLSPKKLLIASVGVATASYIGCGGETSGNLVAPTCEEDPSFCGGSPSTGGAGGAGGEASGAGGAGGATGGAGGAGGAAGGAGGG